MNESISAAFPMLMPASGQTMVSSGLFAAEAGAGGLDGVFAQLLSLSMPESSGQEEGGHSLPVNGTSLPLDFRTPEVGEKLASMVEPFAVNVVPKELLADIRNQGVTRQNLQQLVGVLGQSDIASMPAVADMITRFEALLKQRDGTGALLLPEELSEAGVEKVVAVSPDTANKSHSVVSDVSLKEGEIDTDNSEQNVATEAGGILQSEPDKVIQQALPVSLGVGEGKDSSLVDVTYQSSGQRTVSAETVTPVVDVTGVQARAGALSESVSIQNDQVTKTAARDAHRVLLDGVAGAEEKSVRVGPQAEASRLQVKVAPPQSSAGMEQASMASRETLRPLSLLSSGIDDVVALSRGVAGGVEGVVTGAAVINSVETGSPSQASVSLALLSGASPAVVVSAGSGEADVVLGGRIANAELAELARQQQSSVDGFDGLLSDAEKLMSRLSQTAGTTNVIADTPPLAREVVVAPGDIKTAGSGSVSDLQARTSKDPLAQSVIRSSGAEAAVGTAGLIASAGDDVNRVTREPTQIVNPQQRIQPDTLMRGAVAMPDMASEAGAHGDGVFKRSREQLVGQDEGRSREALFSTAVGRGGAELSTAMQQSYTATAAGRPVVLNSPAWSTALGNQMVWLASQNSKVAEIQLDPPELGSLQVKIRVGLDQQVSVSFSSPHAAVRDAVEQSLPRLKEMLEEQGLNLMDSSVSDQSSGQHAGNGQTAEHGTDQDDVAGRAGVVEGEEDVVHRVALVDYYA